MSTEWNYRKLQQNVKSNSCEHRHTQGLQSSNFSTMTKLHDLFIFSGVFADFQIQFFLILIWSSHTFEFSHPYLLHCRCKDLIFYSSDGKNLPSYSAQLLVATLKKCQQLKFSFSMIFLFFFFFFFFYKFHICMIGKADPGLDRIFMLHFEYYIS